MKLSVIIFVVCSSLLFLSNTHDISPVSKNTETKPLNNNLEVKRADKLLLGAFSVSLSVKDLGVSKVFYENLGFAILGGSMEAKYLIMKNENALIGLFQGMFEGNILTFNPGWDENGKNLESFTDIREIQNQLLKKGTIVSSQIQAKTSGPASIIISDPDGNQIFLDQHR